MWNLHNVQKHACTFLEKLEPDMVTYRNIYNAVSSVLTKDFLFTKFSENKFTYIKFYLASFCY